MSRLIKFRAWHKSAHKMANIDMLDFILDAYGATAGKSSGSGHLTDIELMQFTGLIDKHGKEIFESDIVKGNNAWDNEGDRLQVVRYEDGTWNYSYVIHEYAEQPVREWEVIGNIYEHSELLERKA